MCFIFYFQSNDIEFRGTFQDINEQFENTVSEMKRRNRGDGEEWGEEQPKSDRIEIETHYRGNHISFKAYGATRN